MVGRGRRHEVLTGEGRILVRQSHLPPNSNFSSDLGHFISKILENIKIGVYSTQDTGLKAQHRTQRFALSSFHCLWQVIETFCAMTKGTCDRVMPLVVGFRSSPLIQACKVCLHTFCPCQPERPFRADEGPYLAERGPLSA